MVALMCSPIPSCSHETHPNHMGQKWEYHFGTFRGRGWWPSSPCHRAMLGSSDCRGHGTHKSTGDKHDLLYFVILWASTPLFKPFTPWLAALFASMKTGMATKWRGASLENIECIPIYWGGKIYVSICVCFTTTLYLLYLKVDIVGPNICPNKST